MKFGFGSFPTGLDHVLRIPIRLLSPRSTEVVLDIKKFSITAFEPFLLVVHEVSSTIDGPAHSRTRNAIMEVYFGLGRGRISGSRGMEWERMQWT